MDLNLSNQLAKCYFRNIALYSAINCTLLKVDQKYLEGSDIWGWRIMEKISWTDRVRNEDVLHRVKEERNIIHTEKRRKANWIGYILCRNCLLKQVIEGKIGKEVTGR